MDEHIITGRCKDCEYAKLIGAGNWQFVACYHKPYKGKWTAEIKDCPKLDKESEESEL